MWDGSHAYVFGGEPGGSDDILRYDELRPSAPRALSATPGAGPGEVTLAWLAPDHASEDGVSSYKVYRGTSPGQLGFLAEVGAGQPTFTDRDLELQGVYHYRVTAVNAHGEGPRSNGACSPPSPAHLLPASGEPCPLVEGWREKVLFRSGDRGLVNVSYRYDPSEATCVRVPPLGASCPAAVPAKADPAWLAGQGWRSEVLVRLRLPDGEHVVRAPFVGQALARP